MHPQNSARDGLGCAEKWTARRGKAVCREPNNYRLHREAKSADVFTIGAPRARANSDEDEISGARGMSGKARRVRTRVYADAEETEFRAEKSSARAVDQQRGSDDLYSRHRTQFAGTLDRACARRPREGSAGRALSRDSRHAGRRGGGKSQAGAVEIRREAAQGRGQVRSGRANRCHEKVGFFAARFQAIRSMTATWCKSLSRA